MSPRRRTKQRSLNFTSSLAMRIGLVEMAQPLVRHGQVALAPVPLQVGPQRLVHRVTRLLSRPEGRKGGGGLVHDDSMSAMPAAARGKGVAFRRRPDMAIEQCAANVENNPAFPDGPAPRLPPPPVSRV